MIRDPLLIPQPLGACEGYGGLQRLKGPLASRLGLFCGGRPSPSPPRPACFKAPPPSSSSGEKPGLRLPSSTLLFIAQARPTSHRRLLCLTVGFFRGRKCLLFHEVEIIFLIKDRKTGEPCAPLKRGPALRTARLRNDTIKGAFWDFERHFSH